MWLGEAARAKATDPVMSLVSCVNLLCLRVLNLMNGWTLLNTAAERCVPRTRCSAVLIPAAASETRSGAALYRTCGHGPFDVQDVQSTVPYGESRHSARICKRPVFGPSVGKLHSISPFPSLFWVQHTAPAQTPYRPPWQVGWCLDHSMNA